MSLNELSPEGCIAALELVGERYASRSQLDLTTSAAFIRAAADGEAIPEWTTNPGKNVAVSGPAAKAALKVLLEGDDARLRSLANGAIAEQEAAGGQVADLIIAGGFLVALALASKVSYSKADGLKMDTGFPGLSKVLEQAAKVLEGAAKVISATKGKKS